MATLEVVMDLALQHLVMRLLVAEVAETIKIGMEKQEALAVVEYWVLLAVQVSQDKALQVEVTGLQKTIALMVVVVKPPQVDQHLVPLTPEQAVLALYGTME